MILKLRHRKKPVKFHKSIMAPNFNSKTVLASNPWNYVELWLSREGFGGKEAFFYWQQARHFYEASKSLPLISSPLTSYYCILNATKTLLEAKRVPYHPIHGVRGSRHNNPQVSLMSETVNFQQGGILPSLSGYLKEPERAKRHLLKDIFYNLPFIHRAYNLTFRSQRELFVPVSNAEYVRGQGSSRAWFSAKPKEGYNNQNIYDVLSPVFSSYEIVGTEGKREVFARTSSEFDWTPNRESEKSNLENLYNYHKELRLNVVYIYGSMRLWYLKMQHHNQPIVKRYVLTLIFAAMHRLSELARYHPTILSKHLESRHNWLLSEFIEMAPIQFIDEIASEITGEEFMVPGIRTPGG